MAPTKSKTGKVKTGGTADDFQKIITDARERKENEKLASRIFSSKERRQSAPSKLKNPVLGGSLASRVGVKKATQAPRTGRASLPAAGNINADWTHDLHDAGTDRRPPRGPRSQVAASSLASRISLPSASASSRTRAGKKAARLAAAIAQVDTDPRTASQVNILNRAETAPAKPLGMTIRGLAGPFAVMAQNFAPGTTEADIESAMTPVGGEMVSCRFVKTSPFIIAEMVFASREGGERVIETFNDKTADGRVIKVYPKIGGGGASNARKNDDETSKAPRNQVIDGSLGFSEGNANASSSRRTNSSSLYSDSMVGRGRRGRGGRGGR